MLLMVGIAVSTSVRIVDFAGRLRWQGRGREAVVRGTVVGDVHEAALHPVSLHVPAGPREAAAVWTRRMSSSASQ